MPKNTPSQILRNVLYKIYEGLSLEYREKIEFQEFYESEMWKIISNLKEKI